MKKTRKMLEVEVKEGREIVALLHDLYITQGLSTRMIATRYSTSSKSVATWLAHCNIERRTNADAQASRWRLMR